MNEVSAIDICEKITGEEKIHEVQYHVTDDSITILFKSILAQKNLHQIFSPIFGEKGTIYVLLENVSDINSANMAKGIYQMFFNNEEVNNNEEVIEFEEEEELDIDVSKLSELLTKKVEEKELTLDEILDKISTQGMYSLTDKERKQLDNYANNI
jgi:hypothetical protein